MNNPESELVWDSHSNHVGEMLRDMFINSKHTDVVLVCEDGGRFKVHRNVLSSCSEKFKEIFEDDENISSMFLYGIISFDLFPILELMYFGQTLINQEKTKGVLGVAESLKIKNFINILKNNFNANSDNTDNTVQFSKYISAPLETTNENEVIESIANLDNSKKDRCLIGTKVEKESLNGDNENKTDPFLEFEADPSDEKTEIIDHYDDMRFIDSIVDNRKEEKFAIGKKVVPKLPRKVRGKKLEEIDLYHCDSCDYKTVNRLHMARHKQSKHLKEFLKCNKCEYQTKRDDCLEDHYNFKHLGIKFMCDQCEFESANSRNLKAHKKRIHTRNQGQNRL